MATRTATVKLLSDTEFEIRRAFDAPAELVFDASTKPEHVRQWWGSPEAPLTVCDIDLRPGGSWRYAMREPDGTDHAWHGEYREIDRPGRIVQTEIYEGFPDAVAVNTTTFVEKDGKTTLTTVVRHQSKEKRDGHLAGMEDGMQDVLDRLEALLAKLR